MKGDNVIEAYCSDCGRAITQFDVHARYVSKMSDGKWVCIHHLDKAQKLFSNPKVLDMLVFVMGKKTTPIEFQGAIKEACAKSGISEDDMLHTVKAFCSKVREDEWVKSKKYF
jgi:hypothetical protein